MKNVAFRSAVAKLLVLSLVLCAYCASAQKTIVWIVRHAEKGIQPPDDPALTTAGLKRADDLLKILKREDIAGVYITKYKRTAQTAKPVADKFRLVPQLYDPADQKAFITNIFKFYNGHSVLIVGHSNTILPTLAALGAAQPFSALTDDDYDMLFKVTVKNGKANLEISYYGEPHHTTEIPDQYLTYTKEQFIAPAGRFE
jgi:2,3-bisphosphoglycerate-dependent phosphoglycerate mutase